MRAAITIWDGRVAPVFDVCRQALVLTVIDGVAVTRTVESLESPTPELKLERLRELGIETLVCGAISEPLQHELSQRGVTVIGFVAGDLEEVEHGFLLGRLPSRGLSMPGCGGRRRRLRGGRGGGGRGGDCRGRGRV